MKYTGTKSYNKTFSDSDTLKQIEATTQTIKELIPGTTYVFRVYGSSDCGDSITKIVSVMTDMIGEFSLRLTNHCGRYSMKLLPFNFSEAYDIIQLYYLM